jgi:transcription antitermination factor NusG
MPQFTVTLFDEGDQVTVTDGEFKDCKGVVVGWQHISSRASDPVHIVKLDPPFIKKIPVKGVVSGREVTIDEDHAIDYADVPSSTLAAA